MTSRQDVYRVKASLWITMVVLGLVFGACAILFAAIIVPDRRMPCDVMFVLSLMILVMLVGSLSLVIYGIRLRNYVVVVDGEGIQVYGKPKCPWSAVTDLSVQETGNAVRLVLRYTDPATLRSRKIKIGPSIHGFQVAAMRIIDLVPDTAKLHVPRALVEAAKHGQNEGE